MTVPDRLREPGLRPLWKALHRRYRRTTSVRSVTVKDMDEAERTALAELLGMDRYPTATCTLQVARLETRLAEMGAPDARTVTETIVGPFTDPVADRRDRDTLWAWLRGHPVVAAEPALLGWAADTERAGLVGGSVPATRALLEQALAVIAALPAEATPLSVFAGDIVGDTHALDGTRRLAGLVLRALAALYDVPPPKDAAERRDLWERAGIACDALSTTVLVAGFRPRTSGPLAETLRTWADAGQAAVITLRQLQEPPAPGLGDATVWITENPAVLAVALRDLGTACPPMVCSSGWPNSAVIRLLRTLRDAGARLRYHGDFDGEGLRIAAYLMSKVDAEPWRMSTADYLTALDGTAALPDPGRITEAPWDPDLAAALRTHRPPSPKNWSPTL